MRECTVNGNYILGDELLIEAKVVGITPSGMGARLEIGPKNNPQNQTITISQRVKTTVTKRVKKSAGQLYWEAVQDEAASRTDGSAHPTQPWANLLPETRQKYEQRAANFIDSVINEHVL